MSGSTPAPCGGLRGLLDALWRLHSHGRSGVLGIVIATEGSTYQKPGALVLLDEGGLRHGVISGGCLEPALEDAAQAVHASGIAQCVEFDTRSDEDLLFGSGIGCRGRVRLLLLPLPAHCALARALFTVPERGRDLHLDLVADGVGVGAGCAVFEDGERVACWNAQGAAAGVVEHPTLRVRITAPPQLLLLGAGPETGPLAAFARRLGWYVTVVEHRGRWAAFVQADAVERVITLAPDAAIAALERERPDAVIVMSHNFAVDLGWLRHWATREVGYLGLLGPSARRDELLAELDAGTRARLAPRLQAPVGLDLGGHGGEAVALAIAAQLQTHFARHAQAQPAVRPHGGA